MWVWQQNGEIVQLEVEKVSAFKVAQGKEAWHVVATETKDARSLASYESKEEADAALEKVAETLRNGGSLIDLRDSTDRRAGMRR